MQQVGFVIFFFLLMDALATACPSCNIYNYLGSSIKSSTEIQIAELVEVLPSHQAKFKIVESLKGSSQKGMTVEKESYLDKTKIGTQFIILNPTSDEPTFPILEMSYLDEVRFLSRKKQEINDPHEAVTWLQGISIESNDSARLYLKNHYEECRPLLLETYLQLYNDKKSWGNDPFLAHRFQLLIEAILSKPDSKSIEFLKNQVKTIAVEVDTNFNKAKRPLRGEQQSTILQSLVVKNENSTDKEMAKVSQIFGSLLLEQISLANASNVRWFSYALGSHLDEGLMKFLSQLPEEKKEAAAFGLFDLSNYYYSWWDFENCEKARNAALFLSNNPSLQNLAKEQEKFLGKFQKGN